MAVIPYDPHREDRLEAVQHVVYEYANLLSAGRHSLGGAAPWRTHCDDAFLLGCRKMDDFLMRTKRSVPCNGKKELDDILALDYLPAGITITWKLPIWTAEWRTAMNKQLAHLSYKRDKSWDHTVWLPKLLPEFKTAWDEFLGAITDPDYRGEFATQMRRKRL